MLKNIICIIILCAVSYPINAQIISNFEHEINSYLFDGNWQKSDSLITIKMNEEPSSLKYNFLKAYNYFYTRYIGNDNPFNRDETIRQVKKYTWDAIIYAEELEENLNNNFYLGSAYAMLARVDIMEQKIWEAYWNASKAESYLEDVIDEDPDFTDAYLNLGVIKYFPAATITGFQGVLAWLGGMSGSREKGMEYLIEVSENGDLYKSEAKYILGLISSFRENNFSMAFDYWQNLSREYPNNVYFQTQVNRSYLSKLVDEQGIEFLFRDYEKLDSLYGVTNSNVLNILGYNLMNQNKLDDALEVFKINIKKYPDVANNYDSIAECYLNRGENKNAIKNYKIAFEKLKTDTTLTDQFREFLEENIRDQLRELSDDLDV